MRKTIGELPGIGKEVNAFLGLISLPGLENPQSRRWAGVARPDILA